MDVDFPYYTKDAIDCWVQHGYEPGSFLSAILQNDLVRACMNADDQNKKKIFEIVSYIYNHCPADCWGDKTKVAIWETRFQDDLDWQTNGLSQQQREFERQVWLDK